MKIDIINNERGFIALRDEWNELLADSSSDCLFLTWEWLHTWWSHFGNTRRLFLITMRDESRLVAIAPFTTTRQWAGPIVFPLIEFAGIGTIGSDYLDVIVRRGCEEHALPRLAAYIADNATTMRLPRISETSTLAPSLAQALGGRGWKCVAKPTEVCPYIDLSSHSWDDYLASIGASHRYNFKRRLRNLMKQYDVQIEYAKTDDARRATLGAVVSLHLDRWSERGGSDAFNSDDVLAFHEELSALALERGWLRLLSVKLDGRPAAAFYGFRYGSKFYFYQSGFDPAFVKSSVGLVMLGLTIRDAIAEGASEYDFLHGDEAYKFLWTKTVRQLIRLDLYPPGRIGRMQRDAARVTAATRRLAKRVLQPSRI